MTAPLGEDRRRMLVAAQALFAVAVLVLAGRALATQWEAVRAGALALRPDWLFVAWSAVPVLAAYAILVETWRFTLRSWSASLSFLDAARITFVSNLGKYLPGKVWQIAAMGLMARQQGVSAVAATASSLLVNVVNVFTGFGLVLLTGARVLDLSGPSGRSVAVVLVAVAAVGLFSLPVVVPRLATFAARITGRSFAAPVVPLRAVVFATLGTATAWVLYGCAFRWFAAAMFGGVEGDYATWIAVNAFSYLVGYLAFFAPGGIGVREVMLVATLTNLRLMPRGEAVVMALVARLWLTVLEVLPGALFLAKDALGRRRQRGA